MRWEAGWKTLIGVELDTIYLMCRNKGANSLEAGMWGCSFCVLFFPPFCGLLASLVQRTMQTKPSRRIASDHYHLPSHSLILPLTLAAFQLPYENYTLHFSMLIGADEILAFHPFCVPKMPTPLSTPLMAFLYRPHKSPPVSTGGHGPLLAPIHPPLCARSVIG